MKTDEHLYTLTRLEFAKNIGKSKEAVKKDMMRGKYKDLYIFKNGQYYFKSREAVRDIKGLSPLNLYPVKKSKINRGGHESAVRKGRYPNNAFAEHNHMKKMLALRGKMTPEELAMVPDVERMVKQERQKQLREEYEAKITPRDTHGGHLKSYTSGYSVRAIVDIVTLTITMEEHTKDTLQSLLLVIEEGPLKIAPSHIGNQNIIDID